MVWTVAFAILGVRREYRVAARGTAFPQDKPAFVFTAIPDQDETRLVERATLTEVF